MNNLYPLLLGQMALRGKADADSEIWIRNGSKSSGLLKVSGNLVDRSAQAIRTNHDRWNRAGIPVVVY
jgi:hypothetical protein